MANPILGSILSSVFSKALGGRSSGPFGGSAGPAGAGMGGMGGGLGDLLGGILGRGRTMGAPGGATGGGLGAGMGGGLGGGGLGGLGGNRGMLLAMLLPLAMQWVQRNGGVGAVLDRFKQKGYGTQAQSWLSTGDNQDVEPSAIQEVVGMEELSRLSRQLGVPEDEVAQGFAEILPEMTDRLSPDGDLLPEADQTLDSGLTELEKALNEMQTGMTA